MLRERFAQSWEICFADVRNFQPEFVLRAGSVCAPILRFYIYPSRLYQVYFSIDRRGTVSGRSRRSITKI